MLFHPFDAAEIKAHLRIRLYFSRRFSTPSRALGAFLSGFFHLSPILSLEDYNRAAIYFRDRDSLTNIYRYINPRR